jgi:hypothetical protein
LRHFKALMRKNWINWKRTICGSIMECFCPVLLMLVIVWFRSEITPEMAPEFDFYLLKKPFYAPNVLNGETGKWEDSNY